MTTMDVLGPMGVDLDEAAIAFLSNADWAAGWPSQVHPIRANVIVTTAGRLVRSVDCGHFKAGSRCKICGFSWPCPSRRLEARAGL